jgi:proteasome lid subunit RPN8/RPN11
LKPGARLGRQALEALRKHAAKDYPREACGVLLGRRQGGPLEILEAVACANANTERAADRYLLEPLEQLKIEKDARSRGLEVLGYYHSHPDHPSRASATDLAQSWEGLLYLIQAVEKGKPSSLQGWWRDPGQADFSELGVEVVD